MSRACSHHVQARAAGGQMKLHDGGIRLASRAANLQASLQTQVAQLRALLPGANGLTKAHENGAAALENQHAAGNGNAEPPQSEPQAQAKAEHRESGKQRLSVVSLPIFTASAQSSFLLPEGIKVQLGSQNKQDTALADWRRTQGCAVYWQIC